jgi:SNF2 family DNA or RNA helicase
MEDWVEVFHVRLPYPSNQNTGTCIKKGWVQACPQTFCPNVKVEILTTTGSDTKDVYMPWNQRFPQFVEFVTACNRIFRLQVVVDDSRIQEYSVCVNVEVFEKFMDEKGCFPGEMYVLALLSSRFDDAILKTVPTQFNLSHDNPKFIPFWNIPLFDEQKISVYWMSSIEQKIRTNSCVLEYDNNIQITGKWQYDHDNEIFTKNISTKHVVFQKGGVVIDDSGMGKTATSLRLICEEYLPVEMSETDLILSNCTLIVAPAQLTTQWVDEINKFVGNNLTVITLINTRDVKAFTINNILNADIVITSTAYLRSKSYTDMIEHNIQDALGQISVTDRRLYRSSSACRTYARTRKITSTYDSQVILESILWKRIIIDEVHELFQSSAKEKVKIVKGLSAVFWWGLTATPNLYDIQDYYFFVKDIHGVPPVHHPRLAEQVIKHVIKGTQNKQHRVNFNIHKVKIPAEEVKELQSFGMLSIEDEIHLTICGTSPPWQEHDRIVFMGEHDIINIFDSKNETTNEYIRQSVEVLKQFSETCSICLTNKVDSLLACGHRFCQNCLETYFRTHGQTYCPTCRYDMKRIIPSAATLVGGKLTRSRVKAVVDLCLKIKGLNEKCLIFSQYPSVNRYLYCILNAFDISVFCWEGSVTHKKEILKDFTEKGTLLVLPLDGSTGGIDLVCANHIIFPHLIPGDYSFRQSIEKQAVCRVLRHGQQKQVFVHTVIISDGCEEDLLNQHTQEDSI